MNVQFILTIIIVACAFVYALYGLVRLLNGLKKGKNPCDTCTVACPLKQKVTTSAHGYSCALKKEHDKKREKKI